MSPQGEVTVLLQEVKGGNRSAQEQLANVIYAELCKIAAHKLRAERPNHTLTPAALANEAWLKLTENEQDFESRTHFLAVAAGMMRRILVDHARARNALKRASGRINSLEEIDVAAPESDPELLAIDEALERLAQKDPRAARIIEMRYFTGLSHSQIAEALGLDRRTVDRDWAVARAWLFGQLGPHE